MLREILWLYLLPWYTEHLFACGAYFELTKRSSQLLAIGQSTAIHFAVNHGLGRHRENLSTANNDAYNKVCIDVIRNGLFFNIYS